MFGSRERPDLLKPTIQLELQTCSESWIHVRKQPCWRHAGPMITGWNGSSLQESASALAIWHCNNGQCSNDGTLLAVQALTGLCSHAQLRAVCNSSHDLAHGETFTLPAEMQVGLAWKISTTSMQDQSQSVDLKPALCRAELIEREELQTAMSQ